MPPIASSIAMRRAFRNGPRKIGGTVLITTALRWNTVRRSNSSKLAKPFTNATLGGMTNATGGRRGGSSACSPPSDTLAELSEPGRQCPIHCQKVLGGTLRIAGKLSNLHLHRRSTSPSSQTSPLLELSLSVVPTEPLETLAPLRKLKGQLREDLPQPHVPASSRN